MTNILKFDGLGHVRASGELDGSWGAAEDRVGAILASAAFEFAELRNARPDEYGGQYDALEEGDNHDAVDVTILAEDLEEVVALVQHKYGVRFTSEDREILEGFLNEHHAYLTGDFHQPSLPMHEVAEAAQQVAPDTDKYARALELLRRQMATRAFLGLDPFRYSCDGPVLVAPLQERTITQDNPEDDSGGYVIHLDRSTGDVTITQYEQGGHDD
jgi:hypothetical protein